MCIQDQNQILRLIKQRDKKKYHSIGMAEAHDGIIKISTVTGGMWTA